MSEPTSRNKTSELYDVLPFMEAFPFDGYEITLEVEGTDLEEFGIAPILLKTLGSFGTSQHLNFFYLERDSKIMVSLFVEDVMYISDLSHVIKELSKVREALDAGIESTKFEEKLKAIKAGKKFLALLGESDVFSPRFDSVFRDLLEVNEVSLPQNQIVKIANLNLKGIDPAKLSIKEKQAIDAYLNFQLHYSKIILGIVIATKIH